MYVRIRGTSFGIKLYPNKSLFGNKKKKNKKKKKKKRPNMTRDNTRLYTCHFKIIDKIEICITAQMNGFSSR